VSLAWSRILPIEVGVASGELVIHAGASQQRADIGLYWRFRDVDAQKPPAHRLVFGATGPFYAIRRALSASPPTHSRRSPASSRLFSGPPGDGFAGARDIPTSLDTEFRRKIEVAIMIRARVRR
jgi:hypothetical protein